MGEDIYFYLFMGEVFLIIALAFILENRKNKKMNSAKKEKNKSLSEESKNKLDRIIEVVKNKTKTTAYKFVCEESNDIDIYSSKLGGIPYWDLSMEYPQDKDRNKMPLLAQINFGKEKLNDNRLPDKGILQFFIATDDLNGLYSGGYKVVYHENVKDDITKEDIEKLNIPTSLTLDINNEEYFPFNEEYKITFNKGEDFIGTATYGFEDEIKEAIKKEFNEEVTTDLYEYFNKEEHYYLMDSFDSSGHKIFGYPFFTQYDPREKDDKYDTLLLQIDTDGNIMWGDSGVGNFFINSKDLKEKNFSDVLYNWDCY